MGRPNANGSPVTPGVCYQQQQQHFQDYHFQAAASDEQIIDDDDELPPPSLFESTQEEAQQEEISHQNESLQAETTLQQNNGGDGDGGGAAAQPAEFPPYQDQAPWPLDGRHSQPFQAITPPPHEALAQPQSFPPPQSESLAFAQTKPQPFPPPQAQLQAAVVRPHNPAPAATLSPLQPSQGLAPDQSPAFQHPNTVQFQQVQQSPMMGIPIIPPLPPDQKWHTGLFDCMTDPGNALITACFPCLTFGQIAEIVDHGQTSCGTRGLVYGVIGCCTGLPCLMSCTYRTKMRAEYGLMESPASDCVVHCFCECCALCQEYRELQYRGLHPSIGWAGNVSQSQLPEKQQVSTAPPSHQAMI